MVSPFQLVITLAILSSFVVATADPSDVIALAKRIIASADAALGISVSAVDATGCRSDVTIAAGFARTDLSRSMQPNTAVRGGSVGELLLTAVVLQLITQGLLPQLDETIPSRLMPGGLTFVNPSFPGLPLSLRMILTHTSSLQDSARFDQPPALVAAGSSATDIRTFAASYFLSTVAGVSTIATDIWTTTQPGTAAAYKFARTNIALLMYVLQIIIGENPSLTTVQTVGSLSQQMVTSVAGMTGTYSLLPDGTIPSIQTGISSLSAGKQSEPFALPNHAAYLADYMTLTSSDDLARLAYYLFLPASASTPLSAAGLTILKQANFYQLAAKDTTRGGVVAQGLGFTKFDTTTLCGYWSSLGGNGITCPFNSAREVIGYANQNDAATLAVLCQTTVSTAVTIGTAAPITSMTCVSAAITRTSTSNNRVPLSYAFAIIGEAFAQLQTSTLNADSTVGVIFPSTQLEGVSYGFSVFGILLAVIGFILFLSYIVEFIVRPLAVTGPVVSAAYPKLDEVMDEQDEASPLRLAN